VFAAVLVNVGKVHVAVVGILVIVVLLELIQKNGHCDATVGGTFDTYNDAQNAGTAIGQHTQVEIDPRTHLCSIYILEYQVIWTVGVFFLCLCAATCCCCCCRSFCSNTTISKTPDFNSPEFNPDSDNTSVQLPDIQGQSSSNVIVSTQSSYNPYNQQTNSTLVISLSPQNTDNNNNNSQGFSFPQRSISDNDIRRPSGADQEEGHPSNTNVPRSSSLPKIDVDVAPTTTTTTDDAPPAYDDAPPAYE